MLVTEKSIVVEAIAQSIASLTMSEQLSLLEIIAHQIRLKSDLMSMAQDAQIQADLSQIYQEFAIADLDGLSE